MRPTFILAGISSRYEDYQKNNPRGVLKEFVKNEIDLHHTGLIFLKKFLVEHLHLPPLQATRLLTQCSI